MPDTAPDTSVVITEEQVHEKFLSYCKFGDKTNAGEMDNATFSKLCKEVAIVNLKSCTKTDIDLIFTRAKPKGGRKLDYHHFVQALLYVAEKRFPLTFKDHGKDAAVMKVRELICKSAGGPESSGTKADYVKFHDDKSQYTGVHARGGPSTVDDGGVTLSGLLDRSASDARGVKIDD